MDQSIFIVIEGLDGSGKTEIVKMLHNYLFSKGNRFSILTTREPSNSEYGKEIRKMLAEDKDPEKNKEEILELFIKDRENHVNGIINPFLDNSLDNNSIVICDRYYHSTIAFQAAQGFEIDELIDKNKKFRCPDLTIILDVDPEIAMARIEHRKKEKFEQLEFMKLIRKNFLLLPNLLDERIVIINSNKPLNEVYKNIKTEIDKIIL